MSSGAGSYDPKRIVEQGYDLVANQYAQLEGAKEWPRMRWLRKLLDRLEPGSSILDLGCGSGDPADIEIAKAHSVTGVDISQAQIDLARQKVPSGTFMHGDAGSVEFPLGAFDAVAVLYTLECVPRGEHATILSRVHEWLRPGGLLLVSVEAREFQNLRTDWLGVPMFFSSFDPQTFKQMVNEAGFEFLETAVETQIEMYSPEGREIPFLWILARRG